jgi:abortive infection bacteriophage resistance protein
MRIYNFNLQKTPMKCENHHKTYIPTHKIFDIVYIMMFLILDKNEWNNNIISNIKALFLQYEEYIDISCIGFPDNWEDLLRK